MVHPRPQKPQGESVAKPEIPLLVILSIACKYEVHGNLFSPLFEKQSPCEVVKKGNSIPNISQYITSKDRQDPVYDNQCPRRAGHHRPYHQQTHNYMVRPISRIQIHSYIYIYLYIYTRTNYLISVQAKLEVVRKKHIVYLIGFGVYPPTCCKGTDSTVRLKALDNTNNSKRPSRHIAALTFHDEFVQNYIGGR